MANPEHVAVVKKGAEAIAEWRQKNPEVKLDLVEANLTAVSLRGADLSSADLSWAKLVGATLSTASLSGANLWWTDFFGANLSEANLSTASLYRTDLTLTKLTNADLSRANLFVAQFFTTDLFQSNISEVEIRRTSIGNCDLSRCTGLDTVQHMAPSSIGVDTLIASFRGAGNHLTPELVTFFRGAGVPQELLDALPSLVSEIKYQSCFISYGEPDQPFAEKLREELLARGVSCWLFSTDHTPGERTWREIGQKRREADKMVVICSVGSLVSEGARKEIEEQIDEDPDKLIPISLEGTWEKPGFKVTREGRDLKLFLLERNYADFSDSSKYEESLDRLLRALEREGRPVKPQVLDITEEFQRRYGKSTMTAAEVRKIVDKAMGDKTLTEELFKMRGEGY